MSYPREMPQFELLVDVFDVGDKGDVIALAPAMVDERCGVIDRYPPRVLRFDTKDTYYLIDVFRVRPLNRAARDVLEVVE